MGLSPERLHRTQAPRYSRERIAMGDPALSVVAFSCPSNKDVIY
jgi:hypothetical protein